MPARATLRLLLLALVLAGAALPLAGDELAPAFLPAFVASPVPSFDWDLISLEQNNLRFNGSVLSGFHSVRSPGVTPRDAWKAGVGILFSREELVAETPGSETEINNDRLILNPKLNYGFLDCFEIGTGLELNYATGEEVGNVGGVATRTSEHELDFSAAVGGLKWNFYRDDGVRLAASFDTRAALRAGTFGMLPATLFNFELDGDYAFTSKFSMLANLQFLTADRPSWHDQGILDVAAAYAFSDEFRGMLFTTAMGDEEVHDVVGFFGLAGQYVMDVHSFTFAIDFQLNDAQRELRTENQVDLELSYTFTF
jgi:hypothetical protein